jgi:hypothetical protein
MNLCRAISDQRWSLRAIKISRTCGRAFIFLFPPEKQLPMPVLRQNSGVRNFGQASILPVFTANRSSALQGTALICGLNMRF